jgi:MYXO-CTERM domain-containing protein
MRTRTAAAWISIGVAFVVAAAPRNVGACTCPASTLVSPRAGATDVPINAVIVFESIPGPVVVYDVTHDVEVPSTMEPFSNVPRTSLIHPNQPLAPNTTFEVRGTSVPGDPGSRFTTGTSIDDAAPTYDGFTSLGAETIDLRAPPCRNSCWYGDTFRRMRLAYADPPADTALLLVEVRGDAADGTQTSATFPLFRRYSASDWPQRIDGAGCTFGVPPFATDENVCARLVAFDMAGHRSEAPREICSRAVACAPQLTNACLPVDECLPGSDPSARDAGPDGVGSGEGDGMPPPTSNPGGPITPIDDDESGRGCSLSRGTAVTSSPRNLLMVAIAAAFFWRRRRRASVEA